MKNKHWLPIGLLVLALMTLTSIALASSNGFQLAALRQPVPPAMADRPMPDPGDAQPTLVDTVRHVTARFKDTKVAEAAGYALLHGCVSGPQDGAMGIHFANGKLVGDGALDAMRPEALLYEQKGGKLQLLGVEYIVLADAWDAHHDTPPVLMGQMFNYVSTPNRYRLPGFYELHVWAWKNNPSGMFADWNPTVSCEEFRGDATMPAGH